MNESKGSKKCYDDMNESLRRRIQFFFVFERIEFSFLKVRGKISLGDGTEIQRVENGR